MFLPGSSSCQVTHQPPPATDKQHAASLKPLCATQCLLYTQTHKIPGDQINCEDEQRVTKCQGCCSTKQLKEVIRFVVGTLLTHEI